MIDAFIDHRSWIQRAYKRLRNDQMANLQHRADAQSITAHWQWQTFSPWISQEPQAIPQAQEVTLKSEDKEKRDYSERQLTTSSIMGCRIFLFQHHNIQMLAAVLSH